MSRNRLIKQRPVIEGDGVGSALRAERLADADGGAHCWGVLGARVSQGGSYRRKSTIAHRMPAETSAKAE